MPVTRRRLTLSMPLIATASTVARYARAADCSPIIIGYPATMNIRLMFHTMVTGFHSPRTLSSAGLSPIIL